MHTQVGRQTSSKGGTQSGACMPNEQNYRLTDIHTGRHIDGIHTGTYIHTYTQASKQSYIHTDNQGGTYAVQTGENSRQA